MLVNAFGVEGVTMRAVRSFRRLRDKVELDVDGRDEPLVVEVAAFDNATRKSVQASFPALSGTHLVTPVLSDAEVHEVMLTPVLGFVVDAIGAVRPVTFQGIGEDNAVVLHPNGLVETFENDWSSLEEYRQYLTRHPDRPNLL